MSQKHVICKKLEDAQQVATDTDTGLLMPWPPTTFIGQGPHVLQSTDHYDAIRQHPTKSEWAYASCGLEDLPEGNPKKLKLPKDAKVEELTADWTPDPGMPLHGTGSGPNQATV